VLLKTIEPYTRIRLDFIAAELNVSLPALEELLVSLILDGHIDGHVDQARRDTIEDARGEGSTG
jgi:COP9 signalosome complex subunit 2